MRMSSRPFYFIPMFIVIFFSVFISSKRFNNFSRAENVNVHSSQNLDAGLKASDEKSVTYDDLKVYCETTYQHELECPSDACFAYFAEQKDMVGFIMRCKPKSCLNLPADKCPRDTCRLMKGCDGVDICFNLDEREAPQCGGIAYDGQDVACCEGLVKRCGVEYFDGSCDMSGDHSVYGVPICIPCGNGICNQFENRCNCPEDCI